MATPYTYEESLRVHRAAFHDWLGGLRVDYAPEQGDDSWNARGNWPILRVFASPDRPFAAVADLLVHSGWYKNKPTDEERRELAKNITLLPLPVATIQMDDPVQDPQLASALKVAARTFDPQTGRYVRHPWPGHYRTTFTVNFWCRKQYTGDHIREWIVAQFGKPGANNNEVFIPVKHKQPWGTMLQSLRHEAGADQSGLEGNDTRYIRFSYTFSLRTWVMRVTTAEAAAVQTIIVNAAGEPVSTSDTGYELTEPQLDRYESDNLFHVPFPDAKIPLLWPRTGDARVTRASLFPHVLQAGRPDALRVEVVEPADSADLGEWLTDPVDATSIFSVWFDYFSMAGFTLEAGEREPADPTRDMAFALALPKRLEWSPVHQFVMFSKRLGSVSVSGSGTLAKPYLSNVHVTRLAPQPRTAPTLLTPTAAVWDALPPEPHLVCLRLAGSGPGDAVTVMDDVEQFRFARAVPVNAAAGSGVAALIQPSQASVKVTWPATTHIASAWVQRYHPSYHGNTA